MTEYQLVRYVAPDSGCAEVYRDFTDRDEAIKSFDFWREAEGTVKVVVKNMDTGLILREYNRKD